MVILLDGRDVRAAKKHGSLCGKEGFRGSIVRDSLKMIATG
jgi:hypothetical protein